MLYKIKLIRGSRAVKAILPSKTNEYYWSSVNLRKRIIFSKCQGSWTELSILSKLCEIRRQMIIHDLIPNIPLDLMTIETRVISSTASSLLPYNEQKPRQPCWDIFIKPTKKDDFNFIATCEIFSSHKKV